MSEQNAGWGSGASRYCCSFDEVLRQGSPTRSSTYAFGNPSLYFWTPLLNGLHVQQARGRSEGWGKFPPKKRIVGATYRVSYWSTTQNAGCRTQDNARNEVTALLTNKFCLTTLNVAVALKSPEKCRKKKTLKTLENALKPTAGGQLCNLLWSLALK